MVSDSGEVTLLLERWSTGDRAAVDQLTPLIYQELRKIAAGHLRRERHQITLQPTALIHEAYIRMVDQSAHFSSRAQFFGCAARLMRQILVDRARRKSAARRGGGAVHVSLDDALVYSEDNAPWILRFDAALEKLERLDDRKARAIEMRHFAGLSLEETSGVLGVSLATVKRDLLMAETWILYVTNSGDSTISGYKITAGTGELTPIAGSSAGLGSGDITIDRTGRYLYWADFNTNFVLLLNIDHSTGALTQVAAFPTGTFPVGDDADPVADFLYVLSEFGPKNISAYSINGRGDFPPGYGFQVSGSPFGAIVNPGGLKVDPTGKFLYVVGNGIYVFRIDPTGGGLTPVAGSPFGSVHSFSLAFNPTGQFLYVDDGLNPSHVYAYSIDPTTGALTSVAGSPVAAGRTDTANSVAVDQTGKFAYATNYFDNNVSAFAINAATGALTPAGTFATGLSPRHMVLTAGPSASTDLAITKTHSGTFTQGQVGASYTITVANVSATASSGTVTVADTIPAGLTAAAISGTGWSCTQPSGPCTRTDSLSPSSGYPPLTVSVNVSASAPASVTNVAGVSGGGDTNLANNTASDMTAINPAGGAPDLTISKTHTGNFTRGQTGATYTITVTNSGTASTGGIVTVTEMVPAGLTATAIGGSGWTCIQPSGPCNRGESITPGLSYPALTLTVTVGANAPATVTNVAMVSGGGETNAANNTASDPTTIKDITPTPPTADSVTPNSSSAMNQLFTFQYSSVNGFSYLNAVYALINNSLSVPNGCVTLYVQSINSIYLANDAGSGLAGPLTLGSAGTLTNSQCTINGAGSSVTGLNNTLIVTLSISSKPMFKGLKTIYGYAADNGGLASGWQSLGTWTPNPVSGLPPTADSVTPNNGAGLNQTFVYKFSSPDGFAYINYVYSLINSTLSVPNGCITLYVQSTNALYLFNDAGNVIIGPIMPGMQGSLSNSQCTINGPGSSASGSGNTLTLSVATSFTPSFLGSKMIYGSASDNGNRTSGFQLLGNYMVRLFI